MTNSKTFQRATINGWMSGLISQTEHRIYHPRHLIAVGLINLSFVICHLSFAADPVGQLRSEVDQVLAIAYSGQSNETVADLVRPLLHEEFTFEVVTRQAIGPGWRQFSPSEQQKVTGLFSRLLFRLYAARVVGTQRPDITDGKTVTLAPKRCDTPNRGTDAK